jgi:carbonic anhydrase
MGSKTVPPCEESVVWFVVESKKLVGPTVLAMIRDVLNIPG